MSGFLRRLFRRNAASTTPACYGSFELTNAVRPAYDLAVVPRQGYRHYYYHDNHGGIPVLLAAVSREKLFEVFMDLLAPLGPVVNVVLETSHKYEHPGHSDLLREEIDVSVLKSLLWDFEDSFLNDGYLGIAVSNLGIPCEVQFDEHKLLIVYNEQLWRFERILNANGIGCDDNLEFITGAEHVHSSSLTFTLQFDEIACRLGIENWT
ncbi:MAG: hypothetical protein ABIH36_01180 [bacterium]